MRRLFAVSLAALLSGCATQTQQLPTESNVDLQRYAGTWYEQARLPTSFQDDCVGDVQADYVVRDDQTISVTNQCRTADGTMKSAEGEGRLSKAITPPDPAKLEIRFAPQWTSWLPWVWGDYWIMRIDGDYQYSLVGTPDREYLWVLTREKQPEEAMVEELLDYASTLGFAVDEVIRSGQQTN